MMPRNLIIRTDASVLMGSGHVMRCLGLAQAWQDEGGHAIFVMAESPATFAEHLDMEGMELVRLESRGGSWEDANTTADLASRYGARWVVVDGYQFGSEYQQAVKKCGSSLLFIDDNGHAGGYCADLVLNQNVHASDYLYGNREPSTKLLLGPRFAMLRREFNSWRGWEREIPPITRRVLITLGGSDPHNATLNVVDALQRMGNEVFEVTIVVGGSNPHWASLQQTAAGCRHDVRLLRNYTNMPALMAWADVAITGAGTTCWEMSLLGLPSAVLVLTENQKAIVEGLARAGISLNLGRAEDLTPGAIASAVEPLLRLEERRLVMSRKARQLVDGKGSSRVAAALSVGALKLRVAGPQDCEQFWRWANDPEVRRASFSSAAIVWEEYTAWFQHRLRDPNCSMFVATDEQDLPVGQIRFERIRGTHAEVEINLCGEHRGAGYGVPLLELGTEAAFSNPDLEQLHAFIKPENAASLSTFEKAGFIRRGAERVRGSAAIHYVMHRNGQHAGPDGSSHRSWLPQRARGV
jgi:UDP-2,4-diacetamido-2,4,6-trideoxy-beta-L-altropyranose hydrolase